MSLIKTDTGRTILKKAESVVLVPYTYDSGIDDYAVGSTMYDISAIIGDSIVLEQSEGTTEVKENEFVSSPLISAIAGSKYGFTAQCLDMQNSILKSIFGAMIGSGANGAVNGAVAFFDDFPLQYALIRIKFQKGTPDLIMPKVQMNSRLFVQQLKTRAGQGNIAGTAMAHYIAVADSAASMKLLEFVAPNMGVRSSGNPYANSSGTTYMPYTPVLFVPQGSHLFVQYNGKIFADLNFSNGSVSYNISVNYQLGTYSLIGSQVL